MRKIEKQIRNIVLYARVSTVDQAENGLSLDAQMRELRGAAQRLGATILAEYVEPGASGTDENRKVFRRMIAEILSGKYPGLDAVAVTHWSRFMRDAAKSHIARKQLTGKRVRVIAVLQPTEDGPSGHLMENVFSAIDQYESEINGERTSLGMRENATKGYFNGSQPPFGFRVVVIKIGDVDRKKLEVNPEEVAIVIEIFKQYVALRGGKNVARHLNARGLTYRGKKWSKEKILKIIDDEVVIGRYTWGQRNSKKNLTHPKEDHIVIEVPAIVPKDLFDLAHEVRSKCDFGASPGREGSTSLLLGGLVICGRCGAKMQLETGKGGAYWPASTSCSHRRQLHRPIRVHACRFDFVDVVVVVVASFLACSALAASSARTLSPFSSSTVL